MVDAQLTAESQMTFEYKVVVCATAMLIIKPNAWWWEDAVK